MNACLKGCCSWSWEPRNLPCGSTWGECRTQLLHPKPLQMNTLGKLLLSTTHCGEYTQAQSSQARPMRSQQTLTPAGPGWSRIRFWVCRGADGCLPSPGSWVQLWIQGDALWQVLARPCMLRVVWHTHPVDTEAPNRYAYLWRVPSKPQIYSDCILISSSTPTKGGKPCSPIPSLHHWFADLFRLQPCFLWKLEEKTIIWWKEGPFWDKAILSPTPPLQQPKQTQTIIWKQFKAGVTSIPWTEYPWSSVCQSIPLDMRIAGHILQSKPTVENSLEKSEIFAE